MLPNMATHTLGEGPASLAEIRRNLNLTQPQLAQRAGLSRAYVGVIESGCLPKWDTPGFVAYCEALGSTPAEIRAVVA